jgi:hypothetical protein
MEVPTPLALFLTILLCSFTPSFAADSDEVDPSDPTAAATNIQIIPEYDRGEDFEARLLRLNYDYDWGGGVYSINIEASYGIVDFNDGETETGFGDVRGRFFWKFYDRPGTPLSNIVFNLDVFFPTGDADRGLGLGTFLIGPSLVFSFPLGNTFAMFPNPKLQFSTGKTKGRSSAFPPGKNPLPDRLSEEHILAFELETFFVKQFPHGLWGFLSPVINWDLLPEPGEENYEITLKGQVGKIFGRTALALEGTDFLAGEKSQDYQVKLYFFYYF